MAFLSAKGPPKSTAAEAALFSAAKEGNCKKVDDLLSQHRSETTGIHTLANASDGQGETALMQAAGKGHLCVVNILLDNQADVLTQIHAVEPQRSWLRVLGIRT